MAQGRLSPKAHAIAISKAWGNNFPVDVRQIALELSSKRSDRIAIVAPVAVPVDAFEGALVGRGGGKKWAILYSEEIREQGKINFTIAHEFGHYELHRHQIGATLCSEDDMRDFARGAHSELGLEQEANTFASYLLMPISDFRDQVTGQPLSIQLLTHCAQRYGASLSACALKLIEFSDRPVVIALSKEGVVSWSRSSDAAFKSGVFIRKGTRLPIGSFSSKCSEFGAAANMESSVESPARWFENAAVRESAIAQVRYGTVFTILEVDSVRSKNAFAEEEPISDAVDFFRGYSR